MNLSMPIIDDDLELVRILQNMDFDEYELTDLPMEQPDDSSHELTGVTMAHTSDTLHTSELATWNGSSSVLHSGVDLSRRSCLSRSPDAATTKLHSPNNYNSDWTAFHTQMLWQFVCKELRYSLYNCCTRNNKVTYTWSVITSGCEKAVQSLL